MKCTSSRFGIFEVSEDSILVFPTGLLGFPEHRRYVILDHDTEAPFKWLQSLDEPDVAFVIIDPALFHSNYEIELSREAFAEVQGGDSEEMTTAVILTIPSDDPARITANLRGPLMMNPRTKLCKQVVLSEEFPTRHALFPVATLNPASTNPPVQSAGCPV